MSKLSLLSLVGMIVVAITIGLMYIKPTISKIRDIEDTTALYKTEIQSVSGVNANLAVKLAELDSVSSADTVALAKYLPDNVDEVTVMKDIKTIFTSVGVVADGLTYTLPAAVNNGETNDQDNLSAGDKINQELRHYDFTITTTIDSSKLQPLLAAIEINDYLLQVSSLKIIPTEITTVLTMTMQLTAFSRPDTVVAIVE